MPTTILLTQDAARSHAVDIARDFYARRYDGELVEIFFEQDPDNWAVLLAHAGVERGITIAGELTRPPVYKGGLLLPAVIALAILAMLLGIPITAGLAAVHTGEIAIGGAVR